LNPEPPDYNTSGLNHSAMLPPPLGFLELSPFWYFANQLHVNYHLDVFFARNVILCRLENDWIFVRFRLLVNTFVDKVFSFFL